MLAQEARKALPDVASFIQRGTPEFVQTNLALFAAGFATFAILYCVQPLLPMLSSAFRVTPAEVSLSLSLTTALMAVSLPIAGSLSELWGRKPIMLASLLLSATLGVISSFLANWPAPRNEGGSAHMDATGEPIVNTLPRDSDRARNFSLRGPASDYFP